jgi:hypothetical protein
MPAFAPLVAAGIEIFYRTYLLVVHCRRGRHRSVVVGRAVAAYTGARLWCPCINTLFSSAIPPRALWDLLSPRLLMHAARLSRIPFPILDFTTIEWVYSRQQVLYDLARINAASSRVWTFEEMDLMQTNAGHMVVLTWPAEETAGWVQGRHVPTFRPGWLYPGQINEPYSVARPIRSLLRQLWTHQPRPTEIRSLRTYQNLPDLHWFTRRAERMALRALDGQAVAGPDVPHGEMHPAWSPAYRHPHARRSAPIVPGCVVVVDLGVERGCPVHELPPTSSSTELPVVGHYRGGLTLLAVAVSGPAAFTVDHKGRYGWILSRILRHLDEAPGACGPSSLSYYPLLSVSRG